MRDNRNTPTSAPDTIVERLRAMKKAISVTELAVILGLSRNTVYIYVRKGHIPSYRLRGTVRLDPVVIARWLEQQAMT
jgi:excisionase family DNA binding protein